MPLVRWLCDVQDRLTVAGFMLAAGLVGVVAAIFCYEVVVRYFFGSPTAWTYDVGCYLLAAVIFLSLPEMTRRGAHIHVNLIFDRLPPDGARVLRLAIGLLAVAACLIRRLDHRQRDVGGNTCRTCRRISALPIPKWWVSIFIPYGLLSSALHFLRQLGAPPGGTLAIGGAWP